MFISKNCSTFVVSSFIATIIMDKNDYLHLAVILIFASAIVFLSTGLVFKFMGNEARFQNLCWIGVGHIPVGLLIDFIRKRKIF